jgi:hypothetical protein
VAAAPGRTTPVDAPNPSGRPKNLQR